MFIDDLLIYFMSFSLRATLGVPALRLPALLSCSLFESAKAGASSAWRAPNEEPRRAGHGNALKLEVRLALVIKYI